MNQIVAWFARSPVAANVVMGLIIVLGVITLVDMQRETFPASEEETVSVTVPYPGATPDEIEESIVRVVEEQLTGLDGLKDINGTAKEGVGTVAATFQSGTDMSQALDEVRNEVSAITTFPQDAEEPIVAEQETLDLVAFLVLSGDSDETVLRDWAFETKDRLIDQGVTAQVQLDGVREREIHIHIDRQRLDALGIDIGRVSQALRGATLDLPGGNLTTPGTEYLLRTKARRTDAKDYADITIVTRPDGSRVRLADIASIRNGYEDVPLSGRYNGRRAVQVTVLKAQDQDVIDMDNRLSAFLKEANGWTDDTGTYHPGWLPGDMSLDRTFAWADLVRGRLELLANNGLVGLILVFMVLWFFTNWRVAVWVGAGLPVALLGTLWLLDIQGSTINMISMFAMIMALGILVDDAIIVAENIYARLEKGDEPMQAVVGGTTQVLTPIIAASATSIAAFMPLAMVDGRIGTFMLVMPVTISIGLIFSLIESFLILPRHLYHSMRVRHVAMRRGVDGLPRFRLAIERGLNWWVDTVVAPIARLTVNFRYLVLGSTVAVLFLSFGLVISGIVSFRFFPSPEGDVLTSTIRFPVGTPTATVERQILDVETALAKAVESFGDNGRVDNLGVEAPLVQHVTTIIGGLPSPRGGLTEEGSHVAGIIVTLLGNERRLVALSDVQNAWVAEGKQRMLPGLETFRIDEPARGPGGKDVDIRFTARSTEEARAIADRIRAKLEEQLGVYNVADDLVLGKSELQVRLTAGGRTLGLDEAAVGNAVRNRYFGNEALRFQDGRDEVVVRVQAPDSQRNSLDEVYRTPVPTPGGALVPLSQVATLEEARDVASIQRFNRARVVSVTADLTRETNTGTVLAALGREAGVIQKDSLFDQIQRQYQSRFLFEGVAATQAETMRGLVIGLGVAVVAIYLILVLSFRSWIQPLVIITTIPVGLIGAVFGHALLGIPFTIISIFGIVGLAGIVVNDAITFIHFVLHHFRSGQALTDAVVLAVRERFRPIIMTSATTVVGLLPLLLEQSLQAQFLIPMAASISFGLIASTIGTLVVIPALYVVLYDLVAAWKRLRNGTSITHHLKSRDESQQDLARIPHEQRREKP